MSSPIAAMTATPFSISSAKPEHAPSLSRRLVRRSIDPETYDSNAVLNFISQAGARPHIPSLSRRLVRRSIDPETYRQRNLVERFFNKLKHFRRIATRFDKLARNYLAAVLLASTRLWLRAYESTT